MLGIILEVIAFIAGLVLGFIVEYVLGDAFAVLFALFASSTHELNPFWLGYLVGVAIAHVKKNGWL